MRRGDIVSVALQGDYGKPRPAVVVQSDILNKQNTDTTIVCLITSDLIEFTVHRVNVLPSKLNGLKQESQIMVDKLSLIKRKRIERKIGKLDKRHVDQLNRVLALAIGLTG
jgi:mRNA interferase MazF